jgi:hypothetical protein
LELSTVFDEMLQLQEANFVLAQPLSGQLWRVDKEEETKYT